VQKYKVLVLNIKKIQSYYKQPRTLILTVLLFAFFLPWISYGYISKSAFTIPLSPEDIENILKFSYRLFKTELKDQIHIPKEVIYLYALYLFPILVALLFVMRSRVLSIIIALIPLLPFIVAYKVFPDITKYIGFGLILTLLASVALILESLLRRKKVKSI